MGDNRISVKILFFAQAREQTKLRESSIIFNGGEPLKARDLKAEIIETFPGLKPLENCIIIAKNRQYLDFESEENISLRPDDELAVIPPISAVPNKIEIEDVVDSVSSNSCGATSVFIGTTRDYFENRKVIRLEYEAYEEMALNELKKVCQQVRSKWKVEHIAIIHRLGLVAVKEASIVIAISSPHRKESLEAVHFAIDAIKSAVPIWKKEIYEGEEVGDSEWKANSECTWKQNPLNKNSQHT